MLHTNVPRFVNNVAYPCSPAVNSSKKQFRSIGLQEDQPNTPPVSSCGAVAGNELIPREETDSSKRSADQSFTGSFKSLGYDTPGANSSRYQIMYVGLQERQLNTPPSCPSIASDGNAIFSNEHTDPKKIQEDKSLPGSMNARGFDTPQATLKMTSFSPNISPTTENRIYSGACLGIRMHESMNAIDLNASSFDSDYNCSFEPKKKTAHPGCFASSHWSMKLKHPEIDPFISNEFFQWLSTTSTKDLDRYIFFLLKHIIAIFTCKL